MLALHQNDNRSFRLTPKYNNEETFNKALVGPVERGWVLGVFLLNNPGVNPGDDVHDNHVEETIIFVRLPGSFVRYASTGLSYLYLILFLIESPR